MLWQTGYCMKEWANLLGVSIAPATITTLVREGLLVAEEGNTYCRTKGRKYYHLPYTPEEREARLAEQERLRRIRDAKYMVEMYEDRKRGAQKIYEKCVADAEWCLKETLADIEQWYTDAVAFLEENNEV
jgi:hypothetical protein